ncbi:glycosyltransferase family 2 protein [Micromonospora sp. NPDC050397]|uniref:glycosyltransferase family 2 protein n=1 Tax=Micromonospora sp. NPDC050397 TaxID=3364279 RepID=UPI00384F14CA
MIPTRNKAAALRTTLAGVQRQSHTDFEVVVVVDGATDDTLAVIAGAAEQGLGPRVVQLTGVGRAGARNAGAQAADADLLIFIDDDIVVPPHFVAAHIAAHLEGTDQPIGSAQPGAEVVVHGPLRELPGAARLIDAAPDDPYPAAVGGGFGRTFVNALERLVVDMAVGRAPAVAPWLACVGANVSMLRSTWQRLGGFDESYGQLWGCEDLELGYRLMLDGATFHLADRADGIHLSHPRPHRWEEHDLNLRRFITQHRDPAVIALPELLSGDGSTAGYLRAVRADRWLQSSNRGESS